MAALNVCGGGGGGGDGGGGGGSDGGVRHGYRYSFFRRSTGHEFISFFCVFIHVLFQRFKLLQQTTQRCFLTFGTVGFGEVEIK